LESVIDPSVLNGSTYLIVNQGIVEDLGYAFMLLTGYSKADFCQKSISEVLLLLFGYVFDPEDKRVMECYLFKKSKEVIEVNVHVCQLDRMRKLYLFGCNDNFILNSELSLIHHLIKDNYMGVGIYSCPDFRLLRANQKFQDLIMETSGIDENPLGFSLYEMIPDFRGSVTETELKAAYSSKKTVRRREIEASSGGAARYLDHTIIPIEEGERVRFLVSTAEDVTESTLKRKKIEEKNAELRKIIERKDEMLMLITHELKTPLSVILSSIQTVEVVCKNELSEKIRKYLNKIRQNTDRQLKLVNNILDNTRATSGLFHVNRADVDVVELTRAIVETIGVFAERKRIRILFCFDEKHLIVNTDVDLYERILLNLLSNAIKFTPEGESVEVRVTPLVMKGKRQVSIQVMDNGIGIPNDQKDIIFERFGRADRCTSRHAEGTGIGLYLVKTLVSLLEGEIKVDSKEGEGSTFTLFFPQTETCNCILGESGHDFSGDRLRYATNIEFSDIYY
jgi:signal transduction histidine kinase